MEYDLKIEDREITVSAEPPAPGTAATWHIGDEARELSVRGTLPDGRCVVVDGVPLQLFTVRSAEGTWVWCRGRARLVRDAERERRRTAGGPGGAGDGTVTPATPGVVVDVLVKVGDAVEQGQSLVVLSAMKLETTLTAGYPGRVSAVNTETGAKVMPGEILIEIEPAGDEGVTDE